MRPIRSRFIPKPVGNTRNPAPFAVTRVLEQDRGLHKRGDAVLAREIEVALPAELSPGVRRTLAKEFAHELSDLYGAVADVSIPANTWRNEQYKSWVSR